MGERPRAARSWVKHWFGGSLAPPAPRPSQVVLGSRALPPLPTWLARAVPLLVAGLVEVQPASAAEPDFLREVRPILAGHCFQCHGPDENARKAGLRLDDRDAALRPLKSGHAAIVPGAPESSALVRRVFTTDEDDLMPPPAIKRPLEDHQKDVIRRWVAAGAEYRPH